MPKYETNRRDLAAALSPKRIIPFVGEVDEELHALVRDSLLAMFINPVQPITMIFDSTGGDIGICRQLGDLIKIAPCAVNGLALKAFSSACLLLQYCTKRVCVPSATFLIHSATPPENILSRRFLDTQWEKRLPRAMEWVHHQNSETVNMLASRTRLQPEKILELQRRGDELMYVITAQEARGLNLVDDITDKEFTLANFLTGN